MKTLWIAGWASDFRLWQENIESIFKGDHYFASPHSIESLSIAKYDRCIAWSLGAHFCDQVDAKEFLLYNPALDFCGTHGVPLRILLRMQKKVLVDKKNVLAEFALSMGLTKDNDLYLKWLENAIKISNEDLLLGLQQLEQKVSLPKNSKLVISTDDQITPIASFDYLENDFQKIVVKGNHLPDFIALNTALN